jgi:hypothetical protein
MERMRAQQSGENKRKTDLIEKAKQSYTTDQAPEDAAKTKQIEELRRKDEKAKKE